MIFSSRCCAAGDRLVIVCGGVLSALSSSSMSRSMISTLPPAPPNIGAAALSSTSSPCDPSPEGAMGARAGCTGVATGSETVSACSGPAAAPTLGDTCSTGTGSAAVVVGAGAGVDGEVAVAAAARGFWLPKKPPAMLRLPLDLWTAPAPASAAPFAAGAASPFAGTGAAEAGPACADLDAVPASDADVAPLVRFGAAPGAMAAPPASAWRRSRAEGAGDFAMPCLARLITRAASSPRSSSK